MIVKMTYTLLIIGLSSYLFFHSLESFLSRRHILLMIKVMKKGYLGYCTGYECHILFCTGLLLSIKNLVERSVEKSMINS